MNHYVTHDIYGEHGFSDDVHPEFVSNCIDCDRMYNDNSSDAFGSRLSPRCNECLESYYRREDLFECLSSLFEEMNDKLPVERYAEKDVLEKFKDMCDEVWFKVSLSNLYSSMTDYLDCMKKQRSSEKTAPKKADPVKNIERIKEMARKLSQDPEHKANAYNKERDLVEQHGDFFKYNDKNQRTQLDYFKLTQALSKTAGV